MNILSILLAGVSTGDGGKQWSSFIFLILILVVFYFFMIRPQMKRQKELRKFRENLAKGDKVVTSGGVWGKIAEIKDNYILLEIDKDVNIKVDKASVLNRPQEQQQK